MLRVKSSVTRFSEISTLWPVLTVFGNFFKRLFSVGKIIKLTLANIESNWAKIVVNGEVLTRLGKIFEQKISALTVVICFKAIGAVVSRVIVPHNCH